MSIIHKTKKLTIGRFSYLGFFLLFATYLIFGGVQSFIKPITVDAEGVGQSNYVAIYDGPIGSGKLLDTVLADGVRPDINNSEGVSGNHGFSWTVPDSLKDNTNHDIYVYGINTNSAGTNTHLIGSPKSISCVPPPLCTDTKANNFNTPGTCTYDLPNFSLTADNLDVIRGDSTVVRWSLVTSADTCVASGSWSGSPDINGGLVVTGAISSSKTYNMECTGPGGKVLKSVTINSHVGGGSDFRISGIPGDTLPIKFVGITGADSQPGTMLITPFNGYNKNVFVEFIQITNKDNNPLPSDTELYVSLGSQPFVKAVSPSLNPPVSPGVPNTNMAWDPTITSSGEYVYTNPVSGAKSIGLLVKVRLTKAITEKYFAIFRGTDSDGVVHDYQVTIDPNAIKPGFKEF